MEISLHPIQLQFVAVRELFIQTFYPPVPGENYVPEAGQLTTSVAQFDAERKVIQISLQFKIGLDHEPSEEEISEIKSKSAQPFRIRVHLVAQFSIDTNNFPESKIQQWGKANAPALMFPFLREHVFGLTSRCSYTPLILPMIVLPPTRNDPAPQPELALTS